MKNDHVLEITRVGIVKIKMYDINTHIV